MKTAILVNVITGERISVHTTTEHPAAQFGQAVWVDDKGKAYMEDGVPNPFYRLEELGKED